MNIVTLVSSSDGDWEGIYVYGKLKFQGNTIPRNQIVDIFSKNFSLYNEIEVDCDWLNDNAELPELFRDIPKKAFIDFSKAEDVYNFLHGKINPKFKRILDLSEWDFDFKNKTGISKDGSKISGEFFDEWVWEVLNECIIESETNHFSPSYIRDSNALELNYDKVFTPHGFTVLCESPLEIEDKYGNIITCECANYLYYKFKQNIDKYD